MTCPLVQIHPGHALLEGRKPALLDSLVQVGGWVGGGGAARWPGFGGTQKYASIEAFDGYRGGGGGGSRRAGW